MEAATPITAIRLESYYGNDALEGKANGYFPGADDEEEEQAAYAETTTSSAAAAATYRKRLKKNRRTNVGSVERKTRIVKNMLYQIEAKKKSKSKNSGDSKGEKGSKSASTLDHAPESVPNNPPTASPPTAQVNSAKGGKWTANVKSNEVNKGDKSAPTPVHMPTYAPVIIYTASLAVTQSKSAKGEKGSVNLKSKKASKGTGAPGTHQIKRKKGSKLAPPLAVYTLPPLGDDHLYC